MKIKIVDRNPNQEVNEAAKRWLETLTQTELEELARLDYNSPNDYVLADITKDWIEEHGGERSFWGSIKTDL